MSRKKTTLSSLKNENWKTVKVDAEKTFSKHISNNNIAELNELIYPRVKLVCEKIWFPIKNTNRN